MAAQGRNITLRGAAAKARALPVAGHGHNVSDMPRSLYAAAVVLAAVQTAGAQLPARDLLRFPTGVAADATALAVLLGDGMWNPATASVGPGDRLRVGAGLVSTAADQAITVQSVFAATALPRRATIALSATRASVRGITRTTSDPQSMGEVPYGVTMLSVLATRRVGRVRSGMAVRYGVGQADEQLSSNIGLDAGVLVERAGPRDLRIGAASYLWRPGAGRRDHPLYHGAADLALAGTDSTTSVRGGYGYTYAGPGDSEHYLFAAAIARRVELRGGVAVDVRFGSATLRPRLGVGVRYGRYVISVAREQPPGDFSAVYQFSLATRLF